MNYCLDYLDDKSCYEEWLEHPLISFEDLNCKCYENACFIRSTDETAGVVFDRCGTGILNSEAYAPNVNQHEDFSYRELSSFEEIGYPVILLANLPPCYGHVITDGLKSIWFSYTEEARQIVECGGKFVVISKNENLPQYYVLMLETLGFRSDDYIIVSKNTKFKKIYIPDHSWKYNCSRITYSAEFKHIINNLIKNIIENYHGERSVFSKLYFTRTHFSLGERDMGEYKIEKEFRNLGYHIISPEDIPFQRQVWLIYNCNHFAATEGSISHNSIFCKPKTDVIIIKKSAQINPYQMAINEIQDLNVTFVDAHHSIAPEKMRKGLYSGPFYLCITSHFEQFIGYRIFHFPYFFSISYWWYIVRENAFVSTYVANRKFVHKLYAYFRKCHLREIE